MRTQKISAASTAIRFLSEWIHGEINGKREESQQISLANALDAIVKVYPTVKFVKPSTRREKNLDDAWGALGETLRMGEEDGEGV